MVGVPPDEQQPSVTATIAIAAAEGFAAVGLTACLWAASAAAVETLYVQEGAVVPGVVCDRSRWLALGGTACPVCGRPMRATADVIGELAAAVLAEGGSVRTLRAARELSGQLTACTLRYALPAAGRRHALR